MSIAIIAVSLLLIVAAVGFFIVRRAMRLAVRLILVGAVLLAVLIGAFSLWYSTRDSASSSPQTEKRSTQTRRAPGSR
jgi:heme A synthase